MQRNRIRSPPPADLDWTGSAFATTDPTVTFTADGSGTIALTLDGGVSPAIADTIINLNRDATGTWICDVDESAAVAWKDSFMPSSCD